MYIYTRANTIKPDRLPEGLAYATEIAAEVTAIGGNHVNVYRVLYGAPAGTVLWSVRVESQADLAAAQVKLAADSGLQASVKKNADLFVGASTDALATIVSSTGQPPKPIVAVTQAVIANGKQAKAMEFGVAVQAHLGKLTGLSTAFLSDTYGTFGGVRWLAGGDTMADIERFQQATTTDAAFMAMVESAGDLFIPGSGTNSLIQKMN